MFKTWKSFPFPEPFEEIRFLGLYSLFYQPELILVSKIEFQEPFSSCRREENLTILFLELKSRQSVSHFPYRLFIAGRN